MSKLQLYYPVKSFLLNQGFGSDPAYYARFLDTFGKPEKGHNGNDIAASHGTPVYAAQDGMIQYAKDSHGGEGMYLVTKNSYDYQTIQSQYRIIFWHLIGDTDPMYKSPIPLDGKEYPVKIGDLIGYADNTGAPFESSGDHLHLGLIPVDKNGDAREPANGFNGCKDPSPYWTGLSALAYKAPVLPATPALTPEVVQEATQAVQAVQSQPVALQSGLFAALAAWLRSFLIK